jgi:hypothetical protein
MVDIATHKIAASPMTDLKLRIALIMPKDRALLTQRLRRYR